MIPVLLLLATLAEPPLRIGTITIRTLDIYTEEEARGRFYRLASALHVETKPSVIRKFLLFNEGETFRPERLAETERNLRALQFLKSASVTASPPRDGLVDITVTTQDAWSIAPETQAGTEGGETTLGASVSESNLFGFGREASVSWDRSIDRTRFGIDYQDPAINANFWNTHLAYGRTSDGYDQRFTLRRPFFSFATPWSAELSLQSLTKSERIYDRSALHTMFADDHHRFIASYGRALSPSDTVANRVIGGVRFIRDRFRPLPTSAADLALPDDRELRYIFGRFEHAESDFMKLDFVNKDLRYEDFNIGRHYSIETAFSPTLLGARRNSAYARVAISDGRRIANSSFTTGQIGLESRFAGGAEHTIATGTLMGVWRRQRRHPTVSVARLGIQSGWRLDRDAQFFADGLNGLRGYRAYAFSGSRSMVVNLEHRIYLGRELLQIASPGIVGFIDAGNATSGGARELLQLKVDAGLGLRIGLPRTPRNLLRVDLAYAFVPDWRGRKGWLLSFGSGQAF